MDRRDFDSLLLDLKARLGSNHEVPERPRVHVRQLPVRWDPIVLDNPVAYLRRQHNLPLPCAQDDFVRAGLDEERACLAFTQPPRRLLIQGNVYRREPMICDANLRSDLIENFLFHRRDQAVGRVNGNAVSKGRTAQKTDRAVAEEDVKQRALGRPRLP